MNRILNADRASVFSVVRFLLLAVLGGVLATFYLATCYCMLDDLAAFFSGRFLEDIYIGDVLDWLITESLPGLVASIWGLIPLIALFAVLKRWIFDHGRWAVYLPLVFGLQLLCVFAAVTGEGGFSFQLIGALALTEGSIAVWVGLYFGIRRARSARG